ncbi:MAG: hypothetical protein HC842_01230 [Cytophagales bacterium]|nr:hypothetical protein [Cytophagales bacterium]
MAHNLRVAHHELAQELNLVGADRLTSLHKLSLPAFDSACYQECIDFLGTMKRLYATRYDKANRERQARAQQREEEEGLRMAQLRSRYANQRVTELVENKNTSQRLLELDDRLVQHVYPIYQKPQEDNGFDLRSHFYAPQKLLFGYPIDTLVYNLLVIWLMTFLLFVLLYFDGLRKVVGGR